MTRFLLFEDTNWLAVNKPIGISTHGAYPGDTALQELLALHFSKTTYVCSRLDKETSGVILFAKSPAASGRAQQLHASGFAEKRYYLLSSVDSSSVRGVLAWDCRQSLDGYPAHTHFSREKRVGDYWLYQAIITTGKKHQIRRHAAASGIPILGDSQYGGSTAPRLYLHCHQLNWPELSEVIIAPLPASFLSGVTREQPLLASWDRRMPLLPALGSAFRLINRGELDIDISIDWFAGYLCVWVYRFYEKTKLHQLVAQIAQLYQATGWVIKQIGKNPHHNSLIKEQTIFGDFPQQIIWVQENGLNYGVNLTTGQHVGLFLDQRDNRRRIFQWAKGARVANLFSYTCSFSVAAAAGGAEVVFSVDSSKKYLQWGTDNFAINNLAHGSGKFVTEDVRLWLQRQQRKIATPNGMGFDLLICDPPTFSSTQSQGDFSVEKAWSDLAESCSAILQKNGIALFSNNHRGGNSVNYQKRLQQHFSTVNLLSPPLDFPLDTKFAEHVRQFICYK